MPEQPADFLALLKILEQGQVRFVLIGGLAMVAHGSDHVTQDVDIVYARDMKNLATLVTALLPLHPRLRGVPADLPFMFDIRTFQNVFNLTLTTDIGSIDLLGEAAGAPSFELLWERAELLEVAGVNIRVASLDDLIAMKTAAGRPKDQTHVMELRALRELLSDSPSAE